MPSGSPPARLTTTLHDRFMMLSSSPNLPTLDELFAKKSSASPLLRSGSAAAPIPENVTKSFISAATLLEATQAEEEMIDEPMPPPLEPALPKRVRKAPKKIIRVAKDVIELASDGATPVAVRAPKAKTRTVTTEEEADGAEGTPLKAKPWKKYMASPPAKDTQTTLPKEQVTKASATAKRKPDKKKKTETASKFFAKESTISEKPTKTSTLEYTNLEPALQRRRDWTPPLPDPIGLLSDSLEIHESKSRKDDEQSKVAVDDIFKSLRGMYGFKAAGTEVSAQSPKVLGKRKIIDMVSVNQTTKAAKSGRGASLVKTKAPKKKPRTITELAMATYGPEVDEPDEPQSDDALLNYFGAENNIVQEPVDSTTSKGKQKAPAKATKKKAPPKRPVLLSPESALKQSARQDFVFGTSSQLVREESPTLLRDLQTALRASNVLEEEVEEEDEDPFASSPIPQMASKAMKGGKGLWSVSARDDEGELMDIEIIDLSGPELPQDEAALQQTLNPWKDLPLEPAANGTETVDSSVVEIVSVATTESQAKASPKASPDVLPGPRFFLSQMKTAANTVAESSRSSFSPITNLPDEEAPPPSNQLQILEDDKSDYPSNDHIKIPRPKYELFTDKQLAREVSKFGFKAIKTRTGMVALLKQCWASRSKTPTAGIFGTAATFAMSTTTSSPKKATTAKNASVSPVARKPRARPKKDAVTSSEPSSPRTTKAKVTASLKKPVGRPRKNPLATEAAKSPAKRRGRPQKNSMSFEVNLSPTKAKSKLRKTAASSMPQPSKPKPSVSTPKRKKAASKIATEVPESSGLGLHSDGSGASPLPPAEQVFSSPLAVDISTSEDADTSLTLSPTAQQSVLFTQITKAVTSAPSTTDPHNPSWHEKMLMYDPVILEDLAAWLNAGELTRVGYDDEVSPFDVKDWCESKSICWIWKVTWNGKERNRVHG